MTGIAALAGLLGAAGTSATPFSHSDASAAVPFDSVAAMTSIVSGSTFVDDYSGAPAMQPSCSGTSPGYGRCALPFGAFESDRLIGAAALPVTYAFAGSTFNVPAPAPGAAIQTALSCADGKCVDSPTFEAKNIVSSQGYSSSVVAMLWTANGNQPSSNGHKGTGSPILRVNLVPEPGSLALIGIALAGLALMRRRNQS